MSTGLIITLVICTTLIVLTIANNKHKENMAKMGQNKNSGGTDNE